MNIRDICADADRGQFENARALIARHKGDTDIDIAEMYVDFKQGLKITALEKASRISEFQSLKSIAVLQAVYNGMDEFKQLSAMFEKAFKSLSNRPQLAFEILETWLMAMLETGYLRGFLQVCITRQKLVGNRSNVFRTAFAYYLVCKYDADSLSGPEKSLFPILAARLIEKFEPLKKAEEFYLKGLILSIQDLEAAKRYVFEKNVTEKCPLLEMEMLRLEIIEKLNDHDTLFSHCQKYLKNQIDNWIHWKHLISSGIELNKENELRAFIDEYPSSRNSNLARVELNKSDESKKHYFNAFKHKRCAFEDLKSYSADWIQDFEVENPATLNQLIINVNLVKFQPEKYTVSQLINMYLESLRLTTNKDPNDYHPGDDYILIALAKLLKHESIDHITILKCIVLLEKVVKEDSHQFHVRLWLCTLYQMIGASSLALAHYESLSIKYVQCESMSHFILGRLGSLYPKESSPLKDSDTVYGEAEDLGQVLKMALDKEVYSKVYGIIDMNHRLKNSFSQRVLDLERLRVERYSSSSIDNNIDLNVEKNVDKLSDNRDFETIRQPFPDEYKGVYENLPRPNKFGRNWLEMELLRESLLRYGLLDINSRTSQLLRVKTKQTREKLANTSDITAAERWSLEIHLALVNILQEPESLTAYQEVAELFSKSTELIPDLTRWESIHSAFTTLHTGKIIIAFVSRLRSAEKIKSNAKGGEILTKLVQKMTKKIKEKALEVKNNRSKRSKEQMRAVQSWFDEQKVHVSFDVKSTIEGLNQSLDMTLSLLRNVKI